MSFKCIKFNQSHILYNWLLLSFCCANTGKTLNDFNIAFLFMYGIIFKNELSSSTKSLPAEHLFKTN
ncbi:MAG: hypothetical protein CL868_02130 [Cytophagaceae bacterium]|nr:hypothetical protein [Cytophagaceae bacterium]